jgi:hypothetical protein
MPISKTGKYILYKKNVNSFETVKHATRVTQEFLQKNLSHYLTRQSANFKLLLFFNKIWTLEIVYYL